FVTEDEKVRRAPVVEADGDTRVDGMEDRSLSLDPQQLAAPAASLDDEALGGAGDEVGDHRVDGDPPAGDRDPGLSRRNEDRPLAAAPRLEVELERDGHLPDRAIRADGEHDRAGHVEDLAGRRGEIRRWATEVSQLDAVRVREPAQLRVVVEEDVQAVLDVDARRDALPQDLDPLRRKAAAL